MSEKNIEEFLDPQILVALITLGLIPPRDINDYEKLEQDLKKNPLKKPLKLKDPFAFLERDAKIIAINNKLTESPKYNQNFAQAAREGKSIPEHIKQKMKLDKDNSGKSNDK